jgi:hypothetical protein
MHGFGYKPCVTNARFWVQTVRYQCTVLGTNRALPMHGFMTCEVSRAEKAWKFSAP